MIKVWWKDLPDPETTETVWERQMHLAGLEAYELSRRDQASETTAGQKILRDLVQRASVAIQKMQEEVLDTKRVSREIKGTVLLAPPDTAALLTLRAMMDGTYSASNFYEGVNYQYLCREVAKAMELELNFRKWLKSSKEAAKEYAKAHDLSGVPKSMAERIMDREVLDRRGIHKWKKVFAELNAYRWNSLEQHYCGEALVSTVAEALPETFKVHNVVKQGKSPKYVRMTDEARERFAQIEDKIAASRVVKKPMLTRPRKWIKEDQ